MPTASSCRLTDRLGFSLNLRGAIALIFWWL